MLRVAALRFGVVFGALLIVPFPLDQVPVAGPWISDRVGDAFTWVVMHVGDLLGVAIERHPSGSGDTLADYLTLATIAAAALLVSVGWTIATPRIRAQPRLAAWARVGLRYYLAATMLSYGLAKVFPSQFGHVVDTNLYAEIGQKSPMGILWTFMAVSRPYQVFGGAMECVGGVLLLSRRTTALGALVLFPVLTTVVALNYCYDVPVKLFSTELLLGVIVLLWPHLRRLAAAVFADPEEPALRSPYWRWGGVALAAGLIGLALFTAASTGDTVLPPLWGVWDVARFERDGHELPAGGGDPARWKVASFRSSAMIRTADGADHLHRVSRDDDAHLELGDDAHDGSFAVVADGDARTLTGTYDGHGVVVELRRADPSLTPLVSRGFHWIQEYPFNR